MLKKLLFAAVLLTMLLSFSSVLADQSGTNCWCNIDQYGCWITGEDGGKIYLMFWSEEGRRYIMGPASAPYKNVVSHPGFSGTLSLECGVKKIQQKPAPKPTPAPTPKPTPSDDCQKAYDKCMDLCRRADCGQTNCIDTPECENSCKADFDRCSKK